MSAPPSYQFLFTSSTQKLPQQPSAAFMISVAQYSSTQALQLGHTRHGSSLEISPTKPHGIAVSCTSIKSSTSNAVGTCAYSQNHGCTTQQLWQGHQPLQRVPAFECGSARRGLGSSLMTCQQGQRFGAEAVVAAAVAARGQVPTRATPTTAASDPLSAVQLRVKIGMAAGSGKLDLSECGLQRIPDAVWDLTGLEVCIGPHTPSLRSIGPLQHPFAMQLDAGHSGCSVVQQQCHGRWHPLNGCVWPVILKHAPNGAATSLYISLQRLMFFSSNTQSTVMAACCSKA